MLPYPTGEPTPGTARSEPPSRIDDPDTKASKASLPTLGRELLDGDFWRRLPAYRHVDERTFLDHRWQARSSVTSLDQLTGLIEKIVPPGFVEDVRRGQADTPMALRISPYLLSLIDWRSPAEDPIRRQFIPIGSEIRSDHPMLRYDSLNEQRDSPVPGLTWRYPDRALFLALETCPVYCRFCTRSYAVGAKTSAVSKVSLGARRERWQRVFAYLAEQPAIEDIVVSGGDAYNLRADEVRHIGHSLLALPHVRRIRLATKGPAVMPMKLLTDAGWVASLTEVVEHGRRLHKQVAVHTHFNHPREVTAITRRALGVLTERGIIVRNQTVLQRGVNDDARTMGLLVRRLGFLNVQPYYVYLHDSIAGSEHLRLPLSRACEIDKAIRGLTAGFNTPLFVVDLLGGGGKRDIHSFEHYDRATGVSVFRSPSVASDALFHHFDPLESLSPPGRRRWGQPAERQVMIARAQAAARAAGGAEATP